MNSFFPNLRHLDLFLLLVSTSTSSQANSLYKLSTDSSGRNTFCFILDTTLVRPIIKIPFLSLTGPNIYELLNVHIRPSPRRLRAVGLLDKNDSYLNWAPVDSREPEFGESHPTDDKRYSTREISKEEVLAERLPRMILDNITEEVYDARIRPQIFYANSLFFTAYFRQTDREYFYNAELWDRFDIDLEPEKKICMYCVSVTLAGEAQHKLALDSPGTAFCLYFLQQTLYEGEERVREERDCLGWSVGYKNEYGKESEGLYPYYVIEFEAGATIKVSLVKEDNSDRLTCKVFFLLHGDGSAGGWKDAPPRTVKQLEIVDFYYLLNAETPAVAKEKPEGGSGSSKEGAVGPSSGWRFDQKVIVLVAVTGGIMLLAIVFFVCYSVVKEKKRKFKS